MRAKRVEGGVKHAQKNADLLAVRNKKIASAARYYFDTHDSANISAAANYLSRYRRHLCAGLTLGSLRRIISKAASSHPRRNS